MDRTSESPGPEAPSFPPKNVRVLRGEEELAEAAARAEEGARRLNDRLEARAARDSWTAEHAEQRVGWRQFVRREPDRSELDAAASPKPARDPGSSAA